MTAVGCDFVTYPISLQKNNPTALLEMLRLPAAALRGSTIANPSRSTIQHIAVSLSFSAPSCGFDGSLFFASRGSPLPMPLQHPVLRFVLSTHLLISSLIVWMVVSLGLSCDRCFRDIDLRRVSCVVYTPLRHSPFHWRSESKPCCRRGIASRPISMVS